MPPIPSFEEDQELNADDEKILHFFQRTTQQMIARTVATFLSQPFHVVACRMMAQFIGGEQKYTSVRLLCKGLLVSLHNKVSER